MGWWWSTGTAGEASSTLSTSTVSSHVKAQPISHLQPRKPLTRDEETEQELTAWLQQLESESKQYHLSAKESSKSTAPKPAGADDISPDSLYPTSISCRSAFDYAIFCQSFGGQFVNVYRYGTFRSCSTHWDDFWLCMRTRQWEKDERERAIAEHYRRKAIKYKQGPSSEDIWEMRTKPVKDPFQGDLEALEREVAEWRTQNPGVKEPWEQ